MAAARPTATQPPGPTPSLAAVLARPVDEAARALVGARLFFGEAGGVIVETEAYDSQEAASHSFRGATPRNQTMFGAVGRAYVYRSYGLHWCLNVVAGERPGAAVLIRAIEPLEGLAAMRRRRGVDDPRRLCAGPGCLCQALGIDGEHDGLPLDAPPFRLETDRPAPEVLVGPRIGITKARDLPWRFGYAGSRFLSKPFPSRRAEGLTGSDRQGPRFEP
jgi:DNA-3-methyladenine glycosylase